MTNTTTLQSTHPETGPGNSGVNSTPVGGSGEIIFNHAPSTPLVEDPLDQPRKVIQLEAARTSHDIYKTQVSQAIGENPQQK